MARAKSKRLVDLLTLLLSARYPVSRAAIRRLEGYPRGEDAFHRQFERDKAALRELGFPVQSLQSGPLGGDQQIGAKIVDGEIDFLIFFWDPLEQQAHDPDVKALLRMAVVWNIPIACDRASADFIISSPLMDLPYDRLIPDYDIYRNRKVAGVETPPLPIPGVTEPKRPRKPGAEEKHVNAAP